MGRVEAGEQGGWATRARAHVRAAASGFVREGCADAPLNFPVSQARLAAHVKDVLDLDLPVDALFDVQVKRIHEYKRQLMNCL